MDTIVEMTPPPRHRKRVRRHLDPGHVHELTFSCYHRWPLLTNHVWRARLAESIDRAMEGHRYRLADEALAEHNRRFGIGQR